jgi:hypothetical protein
MKRTDTNTIHNTALELHVKAKNPKKNVSQDNFTMWLSSTTRKNMDQLEDQLILNFTYLYGNQPNDDLSRWKVMQMRRMCSNIHMSGVQTATQVSLRSLRGTNRNRISIGIELESFWSQKSPDKKMHCNCKWQIYCSLPNSLIQH